MENVPELALADDMLLRTIVDEFEAEGYSVYGSSAQPSLVFHNTVSGLFSSVLGTGRNSTGRNRTRGS